MIGKITTNVLSVRQKPLPVGILGIHGFVVKQLWRE